MEDYIIKRLNFFDDTICTLWGFNTCFYSDVLNIAFIVFKDLLDSDKISYNELKNRCFSSINKIIDSSL